MSRYGFVPYSFQPGSHAQPVTVNQCAASFPRLFRYLQPWLERFGTRSLYHKAPDPQFPWALSGPIEHLSNRGFLVLVRYIATQGRPAAAVCIDKLDERLGRTVLPIPNNKSNILYVSTEAEAHFVAAFLNSEPAQSALGRFASSTGVTPAALTRLPLPRFVESNALHLELAQFGSLAAELATGASPVPELERVEREVDRLSLALSL